MEATEAQNWRLFLALQVPEPVKDELERVQGRLRSELNAEVRWSLREQWHLTLKFLGNIDAQQVPPLTEAVRNVCEQFGPLELKAEQIGFFPNARMPRVLWVGVQDAQHQVESLASSVQQATLPFTSEEPEEKFVGHITLARVKRVSRAEAAKLEKVATNMSSRCFGTWTVPGVSLMRSQLGPGGAKHSELALLPFMRREP